MNALTYKKSTYTIVTKYADGDMYTVITPSLFYSTCYTVDNVPFYGLSAALEFIRETHKNK